MMNASSQAAHVWIAASNEQNVRVISALPTDHEIRRSSVIEVAQEVALVLGSDPIAITSDARLDLPRFLARAAEHLAFGILAAHV